MALIAGLVIHSFIIGVNVSDWWRGKSVTPVDLIVTSLGIVRMCAQSVNTLYLLVDSVYTGGLDLLIAINMAYYLFSCANVWLTSLLSIVLCLKISNLHTRPFLYLRRMMLPRTGCLIVASVLLSVANLLFPLCRMINEVEFGRIYNITMYHQFTDCNNSHFLYIYIIGDFFPLLFYSISSVLLFVSLYLHTTRMKMSSNLSINLETYYSAMRFVAFTFLYITFYFCGHYVCFLYYHFYCVDLPWLIVILDIPSVLHSSYLIYTTAKLRSQMSKVLQNVMDFLFQRKN
ncbi:hypothetical protein GDO81_025890, partial [Engystomops pustulosus]